MAARFGVIIPANEAELIIQRQIRTLLHYNHLIEEILELGSENRATKESIVRGEKDLSGALANLAIEPKPLKASISDIIAQADEQKAASEDYLELLRLEPVVLNSAVNKTYSSRPELVPDDRGRILPLLADKYISSAFFEVVDTAVKVIVTWDYISRIARQLDGLEDKVKRPLLMQELSNTCHLEYRRAQAAFRRQMSMRPSVAGARFKRVTVGSNSRIAIEGQPSDSTVSHPQLHYILRLCHPDTNHKDAAQWIQKLDDYNNRFADDRRRLSGNQIETLGDLAIIVSFMHTLSSSLAMVPSSKKFGLLFTGRAGDMDAEMNQCRAEADFGDHVVPMDNLLEPEAASNALQALNEFIVERAGANLGSLYEEMLEECLEDIETKYADAKDRAQKTEKKTHAPLPAEELKPTGFRAEQRREKAKTRPTGRRRPVRRKRGLTTSPRLQPDIHRQRKRHLQR